MINTTLVTKACFLCASFFLAIATPATSDDFQIDIDKELLRGSGGEPFFSELAIGEEAYMFINNLCISEGKLMIVANNKVSKKYDYGLNLLLKREVGGAVSGSIVAGSNLENFNKQEWFSGFGELYSCEQLITLVPYTPIFYTVKTIDGTSDMNSLLRMHFAP